MIEMRWIWKAAEAEELEQENFPGDGSPPKVLSRLADGTPMMYSVSLPYTDFDAVNRNMVRRQMANAHVKVLQYRFREGDTWSEWKDVPEPSGIPLQTDTQSEA